MASVAIVAKDALTRDSVISLLANEGRMSVAGGSEQVSVAARLLGNYGILVVFSDGLSADDWVQLGEVKASGGVRLAMVERSETAANAYKAADMVVTTADGGSMLINAVRKLLGDDMFGAASMVRPVIGAVGVRESNSSGYGRSRRGLTRREIEVARLVAQGMSNRKISQVLELQEQSVKNLVSGIMRKLGADNRVQVALKLTGNPVADPEKGRNQGDDDSEEE